MRSFFTAVLSVASLMLPPAIFAAESSEAETVELKPQEVRDAVRLILNREATAENADARAAAIRDLSKLYIAIVRDDEMALQSRLKLKAKVYSRLIGIKTDLQRNVKRHQADPDAQLPKYPVAESQAVTVDASASGENDARASGGGAVRDYGETLVELIQNVISPEQWDVNGGPGSIVYYPNLKVLVVRASGDAHGHVGGLFDGLRLP